MAGDGFIHRIVKDFGHHVMQRRLVRAADIHAGPFAHRLQPFENFNGGRIILGVCGKT